MVILMKPPIFVGSFWEKEALILEISFGEFDEENIVHPEDIYARTGLTSAKHTPVEVWMANGQVRDVTGV